MLLIPKPNSLVISTVACGYRGRAQKKNRWGLAARERVCFAQKPIAATKMAMWHPPPSIDII